LGTGGRGAEAGTESGEWVLHGEGEEEIFNTEGTESTEKERNCEEGEREGAEGEEEIEIRNFISEIGHLR
jgi:hypothetical protein